VKHRFILPALALGIASATGAFAQADTRMPWSDTFWGYVGASAGESKFRRDCSSFVFRCDDKDTGWKVYGGGNFNNVIGLEVGYVDFGRMNAFGGDQEARAASIALTAGLPIGDRFSIFAKGGAVYARTDVSAAPASLVAIGEKSGWGGTYGAGATVGVTRNLAVRVDWDRYKLAFIGGDRDVDMLSAGVQFRF
jgi:opacity protein-like surface antigen